MDSMAFIKERLSIRSFRSTLKRIWTLFARYGFTTERFEYSLKSFIHLANQYHVKPTLPVTASVVQRHPKLFQEINSENVEWAIHGKYHIDYTRLKINQVQEHLCQASAIFQRNGIRYSGYRFPFLKKDHEQINLLQESGFLWDSSEVISWNSLDSDLFHKKNWENYKRVLDSYKAIDADQTCSLPFIQNGLVEIPVSIPDDDIIIERLGVHDENDIFAIWKSMLRRVKNRGELLVMQVHPERYNVYRHALRKILKLVINQGDVWIASLQEIAEWWQERSQFELRIKKIKNCRYQINADCTDRATIIINKICKNPNKNRNDIYKKGEWEIESRKKPIIGVDPDTTPEVFDVLEREGYPYEVSVKRDHYNHFIKHVGNLNTTGEKHLLQSILNSQYPLIRFWRWPNRLHYGFALTGDIDGVNLWDYGERFHG